MEKHEVVIVGAGPAGLKAAELLGKAKDVLIIEKEKEAKIGDKPCAGGLFPHAMKYFPEELYEKVISSITFHVGDKEFEVSSSNPVMALISRLDIGQYQLKLAKEAGAQIMTATPVKGLDKEKNEVILNNEERIGYERLIAADGSISIIRRTLGYTTKQMAQCIEYPVKGDFEKLEVHFDLKKYGLTYAWIFPHKGYASIGTGNLPSIVSAQEMGERFNQWAKERGIDLSKGKRRAHPIYVGYHGFKHGNIFLTGDAASFACSLDGEGIYQAVKSGEIAAKCIVDPKWNYRSELQDLLKYHRSLGWLLPWMVAFPRLFQKLVENLGGMFMPTLSNILSSRSVQRFVFGAMGK
jgi:geranylgeranyl reductase